MRSKDGCIKTSSNCVVWQGPDIPCLKLCKGETITEVLYKLAIDYCDKLVALDPTKYDISCFNSKECPPSNFIELFQLVIDQICNIQLTVGPTGPTGEPGANGVNGNYVTTASLLPGDPHCLCGGVQLTLISGTTGAVLNTYYICSGCDGHEGEPGGAGTTGATGPQGPQGLPGSAGADGKSGRGIAVFVQTLQPTQADFDSLYGSVEGFGVNYIGTNNTIKPGDIWIEPCDI